MKPTTLTVDSAVRDRLKAYPGGSYSETLTFLMDQVDKERFLDQLAWELDQPERWTTIDWDDPIWD